MAKIEEQCLTCGYEARVSGRWRSVGYCADCARAYRPLKLEDLMFANDEPCDRCGLWLDTLAEKYVGRCDDCIEHERRKT